MLKTLTKTASVFASLVICAMTCAAQPAAAARVQQRSIVVSNNVELFIEGKVINVHDGDTITVLDKDNKKTHIRLQGIDAPELKQDYDAVSQENLARMVMGKQVTIVWTKVDKYRRTVGTIMLNGHDINIEQVKAGLAWHFKKYEDERKPEDRRTYAGAEQEARAAKLGLWEDPNPTPPGEWRLDVKTARWGPPPPEGTIVGNKNSKKYHRPDCPGYRDMAERNRIFFKSVAEAETAGYKRAGNCPAEVNVVVVKAAPGDPVVRPVPIPTDPSPQSPGGSAVLLDSQILTAVQSSSGKVIGNKNRKIYQVHGCSTYDNVSDKNRVLFNTSEDAEKAGYRKAKNCQ